MAGYTGSHNPLLANYFEFQLERIPNLVYFCMEANLPGIGYGLGEQPTSLGFPIKVPMGNYRFEDLTLTFKVDENMVNWMEVWKWMKSNGNYGSSANSDSAGSNQTSCGPGGSVNSKITDKTSSGAVLTLTTSTFKPKIQITFTNLFPIGLSGLKFSTALPESAEVLATATFSYTNYDIKILDNS